MDETKNGGKEVTEVGTIKWSHFRCQYPEAVEAQISWTKVFKLIVLARLRIRLRFTSNCLG